MVHTLILLLFLPCISLAAVPSLVGVIDLGALVASARVSADGKMVVAMAKASGGRPAGMMVIDTSDPERPLRRGFLPVFGDLALSSDGRHGLVVVQMEKGQFAKAARREIVAVDLTDPDNPKERSRRELLARSVALAADASAYAVSRPTKGKKNPWETAVARIDGGRPEMVVDEDLDSTYEMSLSAGAGFLAIPEYGRLRLVDMRSGKPIVYQQDYTFLNRCASILAVLESGHIIVEDGRIPRLAVYAPDKRIPRTAAVAHDGDGYCTRLSFNGAGGSILLAGSAPDRIDRVDFRPPDKLSFGDSWQLPPGISPLAATQTLLFASGNNNRKFQIYRLDVPVPPSADWKALDEAHRVAKAAYDEDLRKSAILPYLRAVNYLQDAGILRALDAPVEGTSAKRAALILNDFGFWASKDAFRAPQAERALRRAVSLDPRRAVAWLNLGDLLRDRLSALTSFSAKQELASEIRSCYRKYLELGGKSSAHIEAFVKEPSGGAGDVCSAVAAYANAGRLKELVSSSASGVRMGGRRVDLYFVTEGTAHVPTVYAFDSTNDFPLKEDVIAVPGSDRFWGGDELGLVVYGDAMQVLHYRDFRHPVTTSLLTGDRACRFTTKTIEKAGRDAAEPSLCRSLIDGKGPPTVEFTTPAPIQHDAVKKRYAETDAANMRRLDFANDGTPVNLVELQFVSGAGAGCDASFYDVVDEAGRNLASGPTHDLLMKLQDVDPSSRYYARCGNKPRFFVYRGKTYFENKPAKWPPVDKGSQYHEIHRIEQGKVVEVCGFTFETVVCPIRLPQKSTR